MTPDTPVDLSNCDREPIHIPGSIQPHAVLVVLEEPELYIRQISTNCLEKLGRPAGDLLGRPLSEVVRIAEVENLRRKILPKDLDDAPHYLPPLHAGGLGRTFEALVHRHDGVLILELEQWEDQETAVEAEIYGALKRSLVQLDRSSSVAEFCQQAAQHVKGFTGFDRVMVYRFAEDASGHVIAEARREDLESYLGLHYPAADIPKQARELFKRSQLRLNPDVRYEPVPLQPVLRTDNGSPLDMSYCVTRSMSPIHAEYLQNMGVDASMSLSIVVGDHLWGLFACHHYSPRYVAHTTRMACEFLAHMISLQVAGKEATEQQEYAARLSQEHHHLVAALDGSATLHEALSSENGAPSAIGGIEAEGAALVFNHEVHLRGVTPGEKTVRKLASQLTEATDDPVWATDRLGQIFPELADVAASASGVMAARLSRQTSSFLLWFRPEETQNVNWAGDPSKAVSVGPNGDRLTPRKSFALWEETVRGRSRPWLTCEKDAARMLRQSILEHFVRHTEELVRVNTDLEERNRQLDSFAYVASHDLKEPLRGISNYSQFLLEDCGEELSAEGHDYVRTMMRLTDRMEMLLDSLLHYSRVSRMEIQEFEVNLNEAVSDALEMLVRRVETSGMTLEIPRPLPTVRGDPERIGELFSNLISNAIKYNDKEKPKISITYDEATPEDPIVIHVRDNGIGIAPEHRNLIFQIFKRLHGRDQYGGGIGAGLTIVRKIIERHGGTIWVDSETGIGTTFSFTLPPSVPPHGT
jgi:light-regulated signal transduction histidine kinase (bacteriophytochrome)